MTGREKDEDRFAWVAFAAGALAMRGPGYPSHVAVAVADEMVVAMRERYPYDREPVWRAPAVPE